MVYTLSVKQIDCLYNNNEMTEKEAEDLLLQSPIKDLVLLILSKKAIPEDDFMGDTEAKDSLDNFEDSIKSNLDG
jgi:hypothetical protein